MERDEFLAKHWHAYPPAESAWAQGWLQGRIVDLSATTITVGERVVQIENAKWRDEAVGFSPSLLRVGDTVAIHLGSPPTLVLLTPALIAKKHGQFTVARSREWAKFLRVVREFFDAQDFIEAWTPTLVPSPGTEPYLLPFSTRWEYGSHEQTYFLPTSPEFHLKKMLAAGWSRLYEIKTCFRNGEIGPHHQPEFQMLEWYRAYANLDHIADDTEHLIAHAAKALGVEAPRLARTTIAQLFHETLGFTLTATTSREELIALAKKLNIETRADDTWDEVYFRLFLERIEPSLGANGPLLVRGYPPTQAALARIGPDGFADRFEVYWRGLELANAFHELNDPAQNEARFRADAAEKQRLGFELVPVDEELIQAFRAGLPPSGGIALGLERLFMAILQLSSIEDVRAFPIRR